MPARIDISPLRKSGKGIKLLRTPHSPIRRSAGFSLVEIMVGLAIGMLALIVMLQVFALSEGRKRTATSGGDAQSNGALVFYQVQRDLGQAGYGLAAVNLLNCNAVWRVASGSNIAAAVRLAPVNINPGTAIIPAGDLNTDTLLIMYGNTNGQPEGNVISSSTGAVHTVQMPGSFATGDRVIVAPAACSASLVLDRVTATSPTTVTTANTAAGTALYNFGPAPTVLAYAIRGGNLTVCDYIVNDCSLAANVSNEAVWMPIASNIVSMRALYWQDTTALMDGIPDVRNQTSPTTNCGWARASAVSLGMVARSSQFEKEVVTTTAANGGQINAPTWSENAVAPMVGPTGTLGPGTGVDEPWKHFRYKVFQAVVPLRNVGWMGVPTGC